MHDSMNLPWDEKNKKASRATVAQRPAVPDLDIDRAHFGTEVRRRAPWMILSVAAGLVMIWIGQGYSEFLEQRIELALLVPMIVYMSNNIGAETLALAVRELALRRISLHHLFFKEVAVGITLGAASGIPMSVITYFLFKDAALASTVAITMIINGAIAVTIGMLLPFIFHKMGKDPALGTDEITTALSDTISMFIYLMVAVLMLF